MAGNLSKALKYLAVRLREVDAIGASGFEGLLAQMLQEVTGQSFDLSKSGPQGGADMRNRRANVLQVGLEAKRYGKKTTLPLDALKAKVVDAARQAEPVDLWILAATRSISGTDVRELEAVGEMEGLAVLVLDWPDDPAALPALAVLCAMAERTCRRVLGESKPLDDALAEVERDPRFASLSGELRARSTAPDIGYAAAQVAASGWLRDAQSTETKARSRLQGYNNLLQADVAVARRTAQHASLNAWWSTADPVLGLVGEEGHGKTWVSLDWWQARDDAAQALPLTIFIPARDVEASDLEGQIADLLARRTGVRTTAFWRKRLKLWARREGRHAGVLLVVDGIDQNWLRSWVDVLQPLVDDGWQGLFRVLVTCRPDFWNGPDGLQALAPAPVALQVPVFTEPELDDLLAKSGRQRADFSPDVLKLMRVPRLSLLAIGQQQVLAASGDVTPERLLYEDWKDRVGRRRVLPFSDQEFQTLIADLGRNLRDSGDNFAVTRRDLLARLTQSSGRPEIDLHTAASEIIDGRWLTTDSTQPHRFKLNAELTPFAMGLALVETLRGAAVTAADAEQRLAEFMDPLKGQSLGVRVLRSATTVAFVDGGVSGAAKRALVRRWILEQNFSPADFNAMWRLIGIEIDLFCDLAEEMWLARHGSGLVDEVLIKAAANVHQFPSVAPALEARVTRWLGWAWPDPDRGKFIGEPDPVSERAKEHRARTADGLAQWRMAMIDDGPWPGITVKAEGEVSWLAHRVIGVISCIAVTPFMPALVAWALSRSVMGDPRHFDQLAWVVRLNQDDPVETRVALLKAVDQLLANRSVIACRAASWLLELLGAPEQDRQAREIRTLIATRLSSGEPSEKTAEPVRSGPRAARPVPVPNGAELWRGNQTSGPDIDYKRARLAFAEADPGRLRSVLVEAAASAGARDTESLIWLLAEVPRFLYALTEPERAALATAVDKHLSDFESAEPTCDITPEIKARYLRLLSDGLMLVRLFGLSGDDQIPLLQQSAERGDGSKALDAIYTPPGIAAQQALLARLTPQMAATELHWWLGFMSHVGFKKQIAAWPGLAALVDHPNADVRLNALHLTFATRNRAAIAALAQSEWTASPDLSVGERAYGSLALRAAEIDLGLTDIAPRTEAQSSAFVLAKRPDDPAAVAAFGDYVRNSVLLFSSSGSIALPQHWNDHQEAVDLLVGRDPNFNDWLFAWMDQYAPSSAFALHNVFPLITLCRALLNLLPADGVRLWRILTGVLRHDILSRDDLPYLPLEAPTSAEVLDARHEVLDAAKTDYDLLDIAAACWRSGTTDWLRKMITDDAASDQPATRARAYTLAGLLDQDDANDAVWAELDRGAPDVGWLSDVLRRAKGIYQRNASAREAHRAFLEAGDSVSAFGAYEVFLERADNRALRWAPPQIREASDTIDYPRRTHWWLNVDRLEKAAKDSRDDLKKVLFGDEIVARHQAPWF